MQTVDINVSRREGTGKQVTRKLRAEGIIPAVIYGSETTPVNLQIPEAAVTELYRTQSGGNFLLNLKVGEDESVLAIVRERQRHPVSGKTIHLDFQRISMDKPIVLSVPVVLAGEAPGVKDFSGTLEHLLRTADVSCLPANMPEQITIDISKMGINDSVHVSDIDLPDVEFMADPGRVVVTVSPPRISTLSAAEVAEGEEGEAVEGEAKEESSEGDAE